MTVLCAGVGRRSTWILIVAVVLGLAASGLSARQTPALTDPALQDARRAYDATDFEAARALLTTRISELNTPEPDAARRRQLATALELRGRTLQNLRDIDAARADFRSMLLLVPDYPFPAEAGARARALFEEVRATTVGMVEVQLSPPDAQLRIDGELVTGRPVRLTLADGTHAAAASRTSHRPLEQLFMVRAGEMTTLPLALERVASTVTVTTTPAGVDVLLDGTLRGRTEPEGTASKPFVLDDLAPGRYVVAFRRPCHVPEQRVLDLQTVQAVRLDDIRLAPATAAVAVRTDAAEASVFVDGARIGAAPQQLALCEGSHVVEVRTAWGRDVRRLDVKTGEKAEFAAAVRPALALVPASTAATADTAAAARAAVERDLGASVAVKLFVPVEGTTEVSAQGLATVQSDAAGVVTLMLLAPGSARPDVVRYRAGDPESIRAVVRRLDDAPPLTRVWLGLLPIDVLDVGVVVGKVDGALSASFRPGDVLTSADGKPLGTVADLRAMADARSAGQPLPVDVRDRTGVPRRAQLTAQPLPLVISPDDGTVLPNTLAVTLTARALRASSALERAAVHLNLAVAWIHVQSWTDATAALDTVDAVSADASLAQDVRGAIAGTSAYLRGIVLERSGDTPGAARAFALAAQSTGPMLIDGAGSLKELVERRREALRPAN